MKKFLLLTLPLLVILSGCAFFSQKEEVPAGTEEEKKMEKYIGIVTTPQDLSETSAATPFILLMESGEKISIDSLNVNLKRYVKRRVEVEGKYSDSGAVFDVIAVTSLGQETKQKQPYQNPLLGLKFQYPSVWILKEELSVLGIAKIIITPYEIEVDELGNVDVITIERSENNRKLSPREWLGLDELYRPISVDFINGEANGNPLYQQSFLGSAQLDSVKVTSEAKNEVRFFVARDTFMYQFSHASVNDSDKDLYRNAFYDLVQSFEFIPFGDAPATAVLPVTPAPQPTPVTPPPALYPQKTLSELAEEEMAAKKAEEERKKTELEANKTAEDKATLRQRLVSYVSGIIGELATEAPASGATWSILNVDLAFPEGEPENIKGMYVTYSDGTDVRRILLSVTLSSSAGATPPAQVEQIAYFKPGETTDWQIFSGADTMKSLEKVHIVVSGESSEIPIKKGMALLDARSFKIKIQYPSSWYWAFRSTGYSFSNKPVSGENVLIHLTKNPEILPENMSSIGELGAKPATKGEMAEAMSVCVQATEKYCLSGDPSYEETMKSMLETLTE